MSRFKDNKANDEVDVNQEETNLNLDKTNPNSDIEMELEPENWAKKI